MKALATVVLPTYNGEKYVKQMLHSIISQQYRPLEIIITDDASRDNTVSIINNCFKMLSEADDIQYRIMINEKNKGLSANISQAVPYVKGKYLFLADQDDIWKKDKIAQQIKYLEQNEDCVMCICDRCIIDKYNKIVCKSLFQYKRADIRKRDYKKILNSAKLYPANCICLRTEHLDNIFPIPAQICEHDAFITIMAAHYGKVGYINKVLTLYRIHDKNLSHQYALEMNRNLIKAAYMVFKSLQRKNKKEIIDPSIMELELRSRFGEDISQWSKKIYSGITEHIYLATIQYVLKNLERWKKFC